MNIVYAVKIFAALSICLWITRLICGAGLRSVLPAQDLKNGWLGIVGTLAVCCFSAKVGLFFLTLPIWAVVCARLIDKNGDGRLPAYGLLCCVSPPMFFQLEHIGPLNDLIKLTPYRIFSIFLLLPEMLRLLGRRDAPKTPSWLMLCDAVTIVYPLYGLVLHSGGANISSIGREMLGAILDGLIPYYVLTRALVDGGQRRRLLGFVLLGCAFQAVVGVIESLSHHYLYSQLQWLYGVGWGQSVGLLRGNWMRAEAAFPGPLALAVLLLFGIGAWFALKPALKNRAYTVLLAALTAGLLATYGRGPILGGLLLFAGAWLLRRMNGRRYVTLMVVGTILVSVGWRAGIGDAVMSLVQSAPGGDETADFNVRYRQELLSTSLALLQQSPWFGVPNFIAQMQDLRQGEGLIDLVNTYLVIALNSGVAGLALVMTPYAVTLWRGTQRVPVNPAKRRETMAWLPLTVGFMASIFTVSPISIIQPLMVWIIAIALARLQEGDVVVDIETLPEAEAPATGPYQLFR
jgi:O-antigen ligase